MNSFRTSPQAIVLNSIFVVSFLVLVACSSLSSPSSPLISRAGGLQITTLPSLAAKTLLPALDMNPESYTVSGSGTQVQHSARL